MPTVTRSRTIGADPAVVWRIVSNPERLPEWWPGVQRVEDATPRAWTMVLSTPKGRALRADYTLVGSEPGRRLEWRHELEESPFERILAQSLTELALEPQGEGTTRVALSARLRLRGLSKFGSLQMRRATSKQLEQALEGLRAALEPAAEQAGFADPPRKR